MPPHEEKAREKTDDGRQKRGQQLLENQASGLAASRHAVPLFSIALRIVSNFRMQAVNANFFAFPAWHKR